MGLAQTGSYEVVRHFSRRKYKADILFCPTPYYSRRTENELLVRTLMALARTDATILCLLPGYAPFRAEIESTLRAEGRSSQVTLVDPMAALNPIVDRLRTRVARDRGRAAFAEIMQVLHSLDIHLPQDSLRDFENIAQFVEAWRSLESQVEFNAVVARCHWLGLCSPVCSTALERGKPVITFQQGVLDHTLDVPVSATHYVAFGRSSATFLARMNRKFFQAVGKVEPAVRFVSGGSLFDTLLELPNQFANGTLLVLDDPDPNGFYGLNIQRRGTLALVRRLLNAQVPLRKVVIRPHPSLTTLELEPWMQLVREHPKCCEISHTAWALQDDLRRASVAVGGRSGALTVAAASGVPAIFLEIDCYATDDLACFRPGQTFPPEDAFRKIRRILTDPQAYTEARAVALRNAQGYYADGANLKLDAAFFERMLGFK